MHFCVSCFLLLWDGNSVAVLVFPSGRKMGWPTFALSDAFILLLSRSMLFANLLKIAAGAFFPLLFRQSGIQLVHFLSTFSTAFSFFLPPPSPLSIHLFPVLFVAFIHSNQGRQLECERESAPALFYFPRPCAKNNNRNGVGELVGGWLTGWVGGCGVCFGGNAWKKSIKQLMPNEWQALPISTYPRNRNGNENQRIASRATLCGKINTMMTFSMAKDGRQEVGRSRREP